MKLIPIFVNDESKEGLYAVQYDGEHENEFRKCVRQWTNIGYIHRYLGKWLNIYKNLSFNLVR